jgi:hypothetical protein
LTVKVFLCLKLHRFDWKHICSYNFVLRHIVCILTFLPKLLLFLLSVHYSMFCLYPSINLAYYLSCGQETVCPVSDPSDPFFRLENVLMAVITPHPTQRSFCSLFIRHRIGPNLYSLRNVVKQLKLISLLITSCGSANRPGHLPQHLATHVRVRAVRDSLLSFGINSIE